MCSIKRLKNVPLIFMKRRKLGLWSLHLFQDNLHYCELRARGKSFLES